MLTTTGNEFIDARLDFSKQVISTMDVICILDKEYTAYANKKRLTNIEVCWTKHPDGVQEYLILRDGQPEYSSQKTEDITYHLDILSIL